MRQTRVMVAGLVAALSLAACGRSKQAPTDLAGELDAATGDTSGLLPNRGGTQYVSAIERTPGAVPAKAPQVKQPKPAPRAEPRPVVTPISGGNSCWRGAEPIWPTSRSPGKCT